MKTQILGRLKIPAILCNFSFLHGVSFQHRGDLGNILADADGRATFRIEDKQLKVRWKECGDPPRRKVELRLLFPFKGVGCDWPKPGC